MTRASTDPRADPAQVGVCACACVCVCLSVACVRVVHVSFVCVFVCACCVQSVCVRASVLCGVCA